MKRFAPVLLTSLSLLSLAHVAFAQDDAENCKDSPKLVWLMDIRAEKNPMVIGTAPYHANDGELCTRGGRFGAHNLHPNFPSSTSKKLVNTTVASWFNGGVRIFRVVPGVTGVPDAPPHIEEIGFYIPEAPPKTRSVQINHAIVDDHGLIYTNDRVSGGLYILRYTGKTPLN